MRRDYFTDYCGSGPYDESYLSYSRVEECIAVVERLGIEVHSVVVLGAATGKVLAHFDRAWGLRPWGCEISRWAHARIPARYRPRVKCADMRRYVRQCVRERHRFDLLFSNSLVYLEAREIVDFLKLCSRICRYFHFWSSTTEDHEPEDPYRVTLRPYDWWKTNFKQAGFSRTRSRYLWRSQYPAES